MQHTREHDRNLPLDTGRSLLTGHEAREILSEFPYALGVGVEWLLDRLDRRLELPE